MRFGVLILLAVLISGIVAWSHGDQKHVIGTVEKISANTVSVKTSNGKTVEIKLTEKTVFLHRDGATAKLADVAVGDRLVIHVASHGDALEATEVKFAKAADGPGATVKPKKNP